ncbi:MAG: aminomethyl transferase family protein [Chloroflexaceae bacterium]|nr:aminomethyl transferase family protein [Chloroflexaceae bacterium]
MSTLIEPQAGAVVATVDGREVVAHYGDPAAEYQAVLTGAAVLESSAAGRIVMRDNDRAALLNRLSTNHIEALQPGQGTRTVLTNHNGRIHDLLTVHALPDQLLLITSLQQRQVVYKLLKKNIFFNDKVKLDDVSDTLGQLTLYGLHSADLLRSVAGVAAADIALHHTIAATIEGVQVWIARVLPLGGAGFNIYAPADILSAMRERLINTGARPLGYTAYNVLRVEMGYPLDGHELSLEYIPLETGLWDAISFNKGCYVGQEIIARMESRNRMAKKLRGLKLSALVELPTVPRKLAVDGKEAGDLTSVVESPRYGPIALAYVRTAHAEPGTMVGIAESDVTGAVIELPFQA